jgi:hypothetical protein
MTFRITGKHIRDDVDTTGGFSVLFRQVIRQKAVQTESLYLPDIKEIVDLRIKLQDTVKRAFHHISTLH